MKKTLILLGMICAFAASAQTLAEPNYELAAQYSAKRMQQMTFSLQVYPQWFPASDRFWYEWKTSEGTEYYIVDPVAKSKKKAFDMDRMAMQLTEIVKDPFDAQHIPFRKLKLKDENTFTFEITSTIKEKKEEPKKDAPKDSTATPEKKKKKKGEYKVFRFEYDINSRKLTDVSEQDEEKVYPRWASLDPDGTIAVYAKNHNLWYMERAELEKLIEDEKDSTVVEHQLTFDGIEHFDFGSNSYSGSFVTDTTERYDAMIAWSPDGKHFATTKVDMRDIKELWVINSISNPRPTLETYKYQMPGEPGPKELLYIFDVEKKSGKQIKAEAFKDQSLDILSAPRKNTDIYNKYRVSKWLGDNEKLYIRRTSRDLKRSDLCTVNIDSDSAIVIAEERLNTYVETAMPELIGGGREFVEWSERNGWANLYLYGGDGTVKRNINDAPYHVSEIIHVDEASRSVIFTATGVERDENPYYAHVYRKGLDGGSLQRLDEGNYNVASCYKSDNGKYFVENISRVDCTPRALLFDNTGRKIMDLEEADFSQLFAAGYKFPEQFKVKAADGVTDLWGVMYKPYDFDPAKQYPIIDYVYPGPQVEGNNISWSRGFNRIDRLAQIGFIVITVGNRGGHPDRSKWYHNYGYGNLRDYGLEDQKYAIQQLAARNNFIDINRVGIHGHSGGGFMSTAAILKYPDFFKVAVSCAGNHDNNIYNRWWSEQHHGILEEVSAAGDTTFHYKITTNPQIARNLKGHLLLVHGDIDNNVHPGNTIRVVDALIRANKRFDMLILPGQRHGFGDMDEYFFWRMADYYSEWLLGSSHRSEVDIRQMNNL